MTESAQDGANIANKSEAGAGEIAALMLKELRPKQWVKNLIVFAPLLFSHQFLERNSLLLAACCFLSFCLIASGVYVLNDVVDVEADRLHPTKKERPIASGRLSVKLASSAGAICLVGGLALSFIIRPTLATVCLGYLALNLLYSIKLKAVPILDVFCIASGFVIRAVAGAVAIHVVPSSWFLLCTTLGALFLALEKRRQELKLVAHDPTSHRKVLSEYSVNLLSRMESVIVPSLLTAYAFYSFQSPQGNWMMLTVPIVLYGMLRYQMLSERGTATGAPEEVFWRDRPIQITLILWVLTCAFVIYGNPQECVRTLGQFIDSLSLRNMRL
jgi:4-hydroxybenzoate polyprenyltransferase